MIEYTDELEERLKNEYLREQHLTKLRNIIEIKTPDYLPTASEARELVDMNIDQDYQEKRRQVIEAISKARGNKIILKYTIPPNLADELKRAGYKVRVICGLESETIIEF